MKIDELLNKMPNNSNPNLNRNANTLLEKITELRSKNGNLDSNLDNTFLQNLIYDRKNGIANPGPVSFSKSNDINEAEKAEKYEFDCLINNDEYKKLISNIFKDKINIKSKIIEFYNDYHNIIKELKVTRKTKQNESKDFKINSYETIHNRVFVALFYNDLVSIVSKSKLITLIKFCIENLDNGSELEVSLLKTVELIKDNAKNNSKWIDLDWICLNIFFNQWLYDNLKCQNLTNEYKIKLNDQLWQLSEILKDEAEIQKLNTIYYGPPGTGKTYEVSKYIDLKKIVNNGTRSKLIQFHPDYSYQDFIDGLKPVGISGGQLQLGIVNGHFKQFCIEAKNDLCNDYYFVIDEINRANLSSVFGELLNCLEYRAKPKDESGNEISLKKWREEKKENGEKICKNIDITNWSNLIETQNSMLIKAMIDSETKKSKNKDSELTKKQFLVNNEGVFFGVPENVYVIGMMNDVDKSIDSFDLALRRRFSWVHKKCDYEVLNYNLEFETCKEKYIESCKNLNSYITGFDEDGKTKDKVGDKNCLKIGYQYEFGHSYFLKINDYKEDKDSDFKTTNVLNEKMKLLFKHHLEPVLKEYLRLNFDENEIKTKLDLAEKIFQVNCDKKNSENVTDEVS